jgi:hypothetical protein
MNMGEGHGYIDIDNNIVIPAGKFDEINHFRNGFAIVSKTGKNYGLIDKNGKYIIKPKYDYIYEVDKGVYSCRTQSGEYKFFNTEGKEIIPH